MSTIYPCDTCGSDSATSDYCDMCGAAIVAPLEATPVPPPPPADWADDPIPDAEWAGDPGPAGGDASAAAAEPVPEGPTCYFCGAPRETTDASCEVCGLDFVSGRASTPDPTPIPSAGIPLMTSDSLPSDALEMTGPPQAWTAIVGTDRAYFDSNVTAGEVTFPDGLTPREVPVTGNELTIGRRSEAKGYFPDIDLSTPVDDPAVSRRHAVLQRQADGSLVVIDVGSTNGTWVNDEDDPLPHGQPRPLRDGDRLLLGAFTSIILRTDGPA